MKSRAGKVSVGDSDAGPEREGGGSQLLKSSLSPAIPHSPLTFSSPCLSSTSYLRTIRKVGSSRSVPAVKGQMAERGRAVPGGGAGMLHGGGGIAL